MEKVLRSLLLTDVVDSTALVESLGEERAAEIWAAHDDLARDLLEEWRGREIEPALTIHQFVIKGDRVFFLLSEYESDIWVTDLVY